MARIFCRINSFLKSLIIYLRRNVTVILATVVLTCSIRLLFYHNTEDMSQITPLNRMQGWIYSLERQHHVNTNDTKYAKHTSINHIEHAEHIFTSDTQLAKHVVICNETTSTTKQERFNVRSLDARRIYGLKSGELSFLPKIDFIPQMRNPCFYVTNAPSDDRCVQYIAAATIECQLTYNAR